MVVTLIPIFFMSSICRASLDLPLVGSMILGAVAVRFRAVEFRGMFGDEVTSFSFSASNRFCGAFHKRRRLPSVYRVSFFGHKKYFPIYLVIEIS